MHVLCWKLGLSVLPQEINRLYLFLQEIRMLKTGATMHTLSLEQTHEKFNKDLFSVFVHVAFVNFTGMLCL